MPLRFLLRSLFCAGMLGVAACGQVSSTKSTVAGANPVGGAGSGTTTPPVSGPVVNSAGFFLAGSGDSNSNMVQYMHQADAAYGSDITTGNFSSECKIAHGSADGNDLVCVAEVEELDLYFNKLKIQYHVPSDMCTYLYVRPYWFYNYPPGTGPTVVSHEVSSTGTITDVVNTSGGLPQCSYDYRQTNGPNCCMGSYNHRVVTRASDGSVVNDVTTAGDWGGVYGNCAEGAATTLTEFKRSLIGNLPLANIYYVEGTGLNSSLDITSPIKYYGSYGVATNVTSANFYKPSEHTGGKPLPMQFPVAVTNSTSSLLTPPDTYEFRCLDAAEDLRQRIRLFVREWNTHPIAENGDPDVTGTETNFPFQLNDRSDWWDFGDNYPRSTL